MKCTITFSITNVDSYLKRPPSAQSHDPFSGGFAHSNSTMPGFDDGRPDLGPDSHDESVFSDEGFFQGSAGGAWGSQNRGEVDIFSGNVFSLSHRSCHAPSLSTHSLFFLTPDRDNNLNLSDIQRDLVNELMIHTSISPDAPIKVDSIARTVTIEYEIKDDDAIENYEQKIRSSFHHSNFDILNVSVIENNSSDVFKL